MSTFAIMSRPYAWLAGAHLLFEVKGLRLYGQAASTTPRSPRRSSRQPGCPRRGSGGQDSSAGALARVHLVNTRWILGSGGAGDARQPHPHHQSRRQPHVQGRRGRSPGRRFRAAIGACQPTCHVSGDPPVLTVSFSVSSFSGSALCVSNIPSRWCGNGRQSVRIQSRSWGHGCSTSQPDLPSARFWSGPTKTSDGTRPFGELPPWTIQRAQRAQMAPRR